MAITIKLKPKPKPKRKAGTNAGLTKAAIAAEAAKQLEGEAKDFSVRRLAKSMGVAPTSIGAHFSGDVLKLFDEVVRSALKDVARPYKPNEEVADYLRDLFLAILMSLHGKPTIAILAVQHLSANPLLVPLLAERLLVSLSALGAPKEAAPKLFVHACGLIFEMIVTESTRSKASQQQASSKRTDQAIAALTPAEFPQLAELRKGLVLEVAKGATAAPTLEMAQYYVDRLIATVGAP